MSGLLRLTVTGAASSQMLLRVVNLLEVRGLALRALHVDMGERVAVIRIGIVRPEGRAEVLVEKLRAIVGVDHVVLGWRTGRSEPRPVAGARAGMPVGLAPATTGRAVSGLPH